MVSEAELARLDLLELPLGWPVFDAISDIDMELGGRRYAPSPPVREAVRLICLRLPDDQQAVAVLAESLPGEDGWPHPLVDQFTHALSDWRKQCQRWATEKLDEFDRYASIESPPHLCQTRVAAALPTLDGTPEMEELPEDAADEIDSVETPEKPCTKYAPKDRHLATSDNSGLHQLAD